MKKILSLVLALCMIVSLAACGNNATTAAATTEAAKTTVATTVAETTTEAAPDYTGKTLSVVFNPDETWKSVIYDYADKGAAEAFPGLTFEWTENSGLDLSLLYQTHDMPDIYYGAINTELLTAGAYVQLDDYIDDAWLAEHYSDNGAFYTAPNGHMYTIGSGADAYYSGTFYYNKDVFKQLGLSVPTTFDELVAVVKALKDAGWERPLCWAPDVQQQYLLEECLVELAPDAIDDICANKTDFNDTRIVEAMNKFQELLDIAPFGKGNAEMNETSACAAFCEGKTTALLYTFSWDASLLTDACTNFDAGCFLSPGGHLGIYGSFATGWFITTDCEEPELAAEVVKFLVQNEAQRNHDKGIVTSYTVEGEVEFINQLAADRDVLYKAIPAENFHKIIMWNAFDIPTILSHYWPSIAEMNLDDVTCTMEDYRLALQEGYTTSTFFTAYK